MQEKKEFINPIDKDKVAENPGTLPYAHSVGSALIKPSKQGVIRSKALAAMEEQTDMQLAQIKKQIDLLAEQARAIDERKRVSEIIYSARMSFSPQISHTYHLYENHKEEYVLSMIAPHEWGNSRAFKQFIASVTLLADHTWKIVS